MPFALPAAALAPLVDFMLGVLITAGSLLLMAVSRWMFNQIGGILFTIPLAGQQLGNGANALRDAWTRYVASKEGVILSYVYNAAGDLLNVVRAMVGPTVEQLRSDLDEHGANIRWLNLFYEGAQLSPFWAVLRAQVLAALQLGNDLAARLDPVQTAVGAQAAQLAQLQTTVAAQGAQLAQLRDRDLVQLRSDLAAAEAILDGLVPVLPQLRDLPRWEAGAERALEGLGRAETALEGRVRSLESYQALLALLSVLGVLSVSQVAELARTARCLNVCERLGLVDDIPDRVEALENAGH